MQRHNGNIECKLMVIILAILMNGYISRMDMYNEKILSIVTWSDQEIKKEE